MLAKNSSLTTSQVRLFILTFLRNYITLKRILILSIIAVESSRNLKSIGDQVLKRLKIYHWKDLYRVRPI